VGVEDGNRRLAVHQRALRRGPRRGLEYAPDFLTIDGGEGGSGAAPQALMDHMALPIAEALPRVIDSLIESGLRGRIRVIAAAGWSLRRKPLWALCVGAISSTPRALHVLARLHPGAALPPEHLSHGRDDA